MRRSSIRRGGIGPLVLGVLVVTGCQDEDAGAGSTTGPTSAPVATAPAATSDAAAATTEVEPTATEDEGAESGDAEPGGDVFVVQDGTVFTTPALAAFCGLSAPADGMAAGLSCEVAQSSVPPGEELMGICPEEGYGWYFNFFEDTGHGGFGCNHHDGIVHTVRVDLADGAWVDQDQVHVLPGGTRVPILDYGRVLRAGGLSCSVQPDGLTCANPETGHGFTVNTASYVAW